MYLEKLKIFGFKSFAKKTVIELTPGVTGIVGPNGCGKSNIVDALRWVLGEQKAGTLRSERMESVIFNGAKDMKPMGMAEVSLTIKNTKNILPVEYTEVVITRRLFRSGESQYLLNNNVCRLKDITDLFMDTGMASNAYSVIELSMVESILSGKPDERRRIFEEAAGVTKYKQRRRITYRKLESTENDLVRVEDIIAEVESKVNSLRRQVKRAQRYQKLTEELRDTEIQAATYKYNKIYEELEPLKKDLEEKRRSRESSSAQTSFKEAETESLKTELIKIEQNLRKTQQELNAVNESIRKQEEEILVSRERSKSLESNNIRLDQEIESLHDRILEQQEISKNLVADAEKIQQKIDSEEDHFDNEEIAFESIEKDLRQKREFGKQSENDLRLLIDRISQKQGEIQRLKATVVQLQRRVNNLQTDKEQQRDRVKNHKSELVILEKEFDSQSEKFELLSDERQELTLQLEQIVTEKDQLKDDIVKGYSQIDTLQHRVGILTKLLENYADYPDGVKHLMVDSNGYLGTVADKISVEDKYRTAIEAVLGDAAAYLLVNDAEQAFVGINNLKENRKGVVTFLPLSKLMQNSGLKNPVNFTADDKVIALAENLVQCEDRFQPLVNALLRNFLLVENLDTARVYSEKNPDNSLNFVTLSGEVLTSWGSIKGGQKSHDESGFVGRRDQVKKFESKIDEIQSHVKKAENRMRGLEQQHESSHTKKADLEKNLIELEKVISDNKFKISQLQYKISQSDEQSEKIEVELSQLTTEIETANKTIEQTSRQLEDEIEERNAKEEELALFNKTIEEIAVKRDALSEKVQQSRLKLVQLNSELKSKQHDLERSRQIIAESEASIKLKNKERANNSEQAKNLGIRIEELTNTLSADYTKKEQIEGVVSKIENDQISLKDQIDEREKTLRILRNERESTSESIHHVDLRIAELKLNADNLYRQIGEEYDHDLKRERIDPEYNVQSDEDLIETLKQRIKNLGPVNLLALKEYEKEKERFDFLQKQHDDLVEAKMNLTNTVDHINKTAMEKFLEIFEKIRINFGHVFNRFFHEGIADVKLIDKDDPLESDIEIMANPKSKRATPLTLLSGGEKALTAISLLFAIYQVKPSPFCILDEVDAPLDDNNVRRFTDALKQFSPETQFLVVTHNKLTMKSANSLYGITMEASGVSKIVSVKLE